jgi:hypothetical protein
MVKAIIEDMAALIEMERELLDITVMPATMVPTIW